MASMNVNIHISIDDREFRRLMNSARFVPTFNRQMSQQFLSIGEHAKRAIRHQIEGEDYAPLGVWRYIKGSDAVLIYTGSLSKGWTYSFTRQSGGAVVGIRIKPTGTHSSGLPMSKIAEILHNGAQWAPSKAQRQALAIRAAAAGAPPPVGQKKEIWRIPPRPFLKDALTSTKFLERVQRHSIRALHRTFRDLKRG
jgi:hypothetical protein